MGYDAGSYEGVDAQKREYMYNRLISARPDLASRVDLLYDSSAVELEYYRGINNGSIPDQSKAVDRWQFTPPSLHRLDSATAKASTKLATILGLGDSLFEGASASTYVNSIPGLASAALQARIGMRGCREAFIPAAWPSEGGPTPSPQDMIPATTGTVTKATGSTSSLGPGRKSIQLSAGATLTFKPVVCTGYDIIYGGVISNGNSFTYNHGDGAVSVSTSTTRTTLTAQATAGATVIAVAAVPSDWFPGAQLIINPAGPTETVYIQSISGLNVTLKAALASTWASATPVGGHGMGGYVKQVRGLGAISRSVTITAVSTTTIEGIRYYNGDENGGIQWINAGHGGIRADQLKSTGNSDRSFDYIGVLAPDAVICDLMINDSGVQTPSQVTTNLNQLRTDINSSITSRGGQIPSWIQVIPYEIDPTNARYQGNAWSAYVDAVYAWARADTTGPGGSSGIHVVDLGRRMPRSDQSSKFYSADKIHPTDAGAAEFIYWTFRSLPAL